MKNDDVNEILSTTTNSDGIKMAAGMELIFGDSFPFFQAVQVDLSSRQLLVQQQNLVINLRNTELLNAVLNESLQTNQNLSIIFSEINEFKNLVMKKEYTEERRNLLKDLIFNLNRVFTESQKNQDVYYKYYISLSLLEIIENKKLTTRDFVEIEDKEYFVNILDKLNQEIQETPDFIKKEVSMFLQTYNVVSKLYSELNDDKYYTNRVVVTYEGGEPARMDEPEILRIRSQLFESIKSELPSIYDFFSELRKYCSSVDGLSSVSQDYFHSLKEYQCSVEWNKTFTEYKEIKTREDYLNEKYSKLKQQYHDLAPFIIRYLKKHESFLTSFMMPELNLQAIPSEERNYNEILRNRIQSKIEQIENDEKEIIYLLEKRMVAYNQFLIQKNNKKVFFGLFGKKI